MLTFLIKEFLFDNSENERIGVGVEIVLHKHEMSTKLIGVFRTLEQFFNKFLKREKFKESEIFLVHARFEMKHSQFIAIKFQERKPILYLNNAAVSAAKKQKIDEKTSEVPDDFQSEVDEVFRNVAVRTHILNPMGALIRNFESIPGKQYCPQRKIAGAALFKKILVLCFDILELLEEENENFAENLKTRFEACVEQEKFRSLCENFEGLSRFARSETTSLVGGPSAMRCPSVASL